MDELGEIIHQAPDKVRAFVLFIRPSGVSTDWHKTELLRRATELSGVEVIVDEEGREAHLFGAYTSGQTILFNEQGDVLFAGGITAARGHAGENPGRTQILAILSRQEPSRTKRPVFGCPLFD